MTDNDIERRVKTAFDNIHADEEIKEHVINRSFKTARKKRRLLPVAAAGLAAAAVAVFAAVHSITYEDNTDIAAETTTEQPTSAAKLPDGTLLPEKSELPATAVPVMEAEEERHSTEYYMQQALQGLEDKPESAPAIKYENEIQTENPIRNTEPPAIRETEPPEPEEYEYRIASSMDQLPDMSVISAVLGVFDRCEEPGGLEYIYTEITDRARLGDDMKYKGSISYQLGDGKVMRLYNYTGDNGRYANIITSDDSAYVDEVLESPEVNNSSVSDIPVDDTNPDEVYFFYMHIDNTAYVINTHRLTKQENMELLYSLGGE